MKASIIFRDDQNPFLRAKFPLNFFGFPLRSAIEVADPDHLSFTFSTFFRSGPSFNLSYRPNDSFSPFTLGVKTGIGLFGSPVNAPMTLTAEFNLPGNGAPRFFLHFRPQVGDFTLRRSVQSQMPNLPYRTSIFTKALVNDVALSKGKSVDGGETSREADGDLTLGNAVFSGQGINSSQVLNCIDDVLSSVEISARTTFKVRDRAAVKFQWSMRFPACMKNSIPGGEDFTAKFPFSKMPYLALGKIKIERVATNDGEQQTNEAAGAGEFSALKKQLDDLWTESQWLKKNIEQLRTEIGDQKAARVTPPVESRKKR